MSIISNPGSGFGGQSTPDFIMIAGAKAFDRLVKQLRLQPEEIEGFARNFRSELERQIPELMTVIGVTAALPLIGERSRKHFLFGKKESPETAEDLGHEVVAKVLKAIRGGWPHGNVGAWLATIRNHVFVDHLRIKKRERDTFRDFDDQAPDEGV